MQAPSPLRSADLHLDTGWVEARWVKILDRIEHRQPDVGLRFWGPPLWLEVTMTGPDSDLWPAISESTAWDWQSSAPCTEAAALADDGADDDRLLAVVSRYTIENLILNAVHEIGEWFRLDGRRLFPAHSSVAAAPSDADEQGNGAVTVHLTFGPTAHLPGAVATGPPSEHRSDAHLVSRLAELAAPSRFTYLPGTTIAYEAGGPVIRRWSGGERGRVWRSTWSSSTLEAVAAGSADVLALVGRDVHRALVAHEADRICRAFHVDGRRPWGLGDRGFALGADPPDADAPDAQLLSIDIDYPHTSDCDTPAGTRRPRGTGPVAILRRAHMAVGAARAEDVFLHAAALAFYGLISVAPLVVVALWVTTLAVGAGQVHHVADQLARLAPPALGVDHALQRVAALSTTLGLVAVAAALWPATAYGAGLVRVLDRVGGDRDSAGLRGRGAGLLLVGLVPVLVLGSLVAGYAGAATLGHSPTDVAVGLCVGLILSFAATVAAVAVIYKVFPRSPPGWRDTLRGALVAAASIAVLSVGYVAYLRLGANFEHRYASDALASVVLLGVWLYAADIALLVGYRVARRLRPQKGRAEP